MIIKQKIYDAIEVSRQPKNAISKKVQCIEGGYYQIYLSILKNKKVVLYMGGGTDSEPLYKIDHIFSSSEAAILYTMYFYLKEDN